MKKTLIALLLFCAIFVSAGCGSLLLYMLEGEQGSGPASNPSGITTSVTPPGASLPPDHNPNTANPAPAPPPVTPTEPGGITIKTDLLQMIGKTYADIRAMNGVNGFCYPYHGRAFADYYDELVPYPFGFFLVVDDNEFMRLVTGYDTIVWPDNSTVYGIYLWSEDFKYLFQSEGPITYDALSKIMPEHSKLIHDPEEEQELDYYGFDVWYSVFKFEKYSLEATFYEENNELVLIEAIIQDNSLLPVWTPTPAPMPTPTPIPPPTPSFPPADEPLGYYVNFRSDGTPANSLSWIELYFLTGRCGFGINYPDGMADYIGYFEYYDGCVTIEPNIGWDIPIVATHGELTLIVDILRFRIEGGNLIFDEDFAVGQIRKGDVFRYVP